MSQLSLKAASAKHKQWAEFGIRFWLGVFRLMPTFLLAGIYRTFWIGKRTRNKLGDVFKDNVTALMPDLLADLPEKSHEFTKNIYRIDKSRRLLPFSSLRSIKKMLTEVSVENGTEWCRDEAKVQFISIHQFGCLQSILLSLVNRVSNDRTAVIILDVYSRHFVSNVILNGILRTLHPAGETLVLRNDDPSLEEKLASLIEGDKKLAIFFPTTLCLKGEDCNYINLFSRKVVASKKIESLINQTSESNSVYTVHSNMTLFTASKQQLSIAKIVMPKVSSQRFHTDYSWSNEIYADLQDAVVNQITGWHLWLDIESFYGRKQLKEVEQEMKTNFDSFITGRVETPPILRFFSYGVLSIFFTAAVVLVNVNYAASDTAVGYLLGADNKAEIKIANTGQVVNLNVEEGDYVEMGDLLFKLKVSGSINKHSPLGETVTAQLGQDIETLHRNMEYIKLDHEQNRKLLSSDISAKTEQVESIDQIIAKQNQHIRLFRKQVNRLKDLHERKLAPQAKYEGEQLKLINAEKELANYEFRRKGLLTDIERLKNEKAKSEFKLQLVLNNEEMKISGIQKQLAELNEDRLVTVNAERSGIVNNLKLSLGDTVVVDGRPIMEITPEEQGSVKHAVLFIPTSFLNNTEIGQDVRVMVDAFPVDEFGSFNGKIVKMSSSSFKHSDFVVDLPRGSLYYKADIEIYTSKAKKSLPMQGFKTGMLISADILQPEISLFEWLFEPFFKAFTRMF
ncbi:hypothetical protein CS022_08120 [Veronia nyctiphanis]|uniref:Uncharacterized protein n=1 Tax=Veronia nyctiphanis TaxID=1278244 RepID=A0A4Q0YRF9_9GAMM|nr:HlyD family efflux transporter periplasmic adaptor subunit [Veronia nyctiphanis]RXJ73696.1 hypothetical protein CS022_08120 [Veronia nyctiphanis]